MHLVKKYKIFLFFLLVFGVFLIVPKPANAIIGTGIFDYCSAVLDAFDFIDQSVLAFLVKVIFFAFGSAAFVFMAANILEWSFQLPVSLSNDLVLSGFNFVLGLVNLFFILALVFIALAYILKIESLELKKALPRLIIVILLVNFSRLIVGALVDVSQFFMNTFLDTFGGDFVTLSLIPLRTSFGALMNVILITITGYVASAFTVFGSIFALAIILSQFFGGDLLANVISLVLMIVLNFVMGAIFFMFAVLFIVRIAALWLLTIFAPLAFFALIFKQTKGYAEKWFKEVIQWAFLGVVAFFLLSLIISLFTSAFIHRPGMLNVSPIPGLPPIRLPSNIYDYIFLIIFLVVAFEASRRYVPQGAQQVIGLMKGQWAAMGGVAGITKRLKSGATGAARRLTPERAKKKAREMAAASTLPTGKEWKKMTRREKLKRVLISPHATRAVGKAVVGATDSADERVYGQARKAALGEDAAANLNAFSSTSDPTIRAARISGMMEQGQMKEAMDEKRFGKNALQYHGWDVRSAYQKAARMGKKKDLEGMERSFGENFTGYFQDIKDKEGVYTKEDLKKDGFKNFTEYIAANTKSAKDIKQLNKDWIDREEFMEATHEFWSGHQIGEAAREFGKEFASNFQATAKDIKWYFETNPETGRMNNPNVPRYMASNAAASAGMGPIKGGESRDKLEPYLRKGQAEEKVKREEEIRKKREKEIVATGGKITRPLTIKEVKKEKKAEIWEKSTKPLTPKEVKRLKKLLKEEKEKEK